METATLQTTPQSSIDLPGIKKLRSGKVREVFDLGDTLLFVVSDRLSAFDVILPDPIPFKGAVLNQISAFWFKRFDDNRRIILSRRISMSSEQIAIVPRQLAGRSMIVKKPRRSPSNASCAVIWPARAGKNIRNRRLFAASTAAGLNSLDSRRRFSRPQPRPKPGHDENIDWKECGKFSETNGDARAKV